MLSIGACQVKTVVRYTSSLASSWISVGSSLSYMSSSKVFGMEVGQKVLSFLENIIGT
jgi:hypothetical protein